MTEPQIDEDALVAAADLVGRTGATAMEVGHVHDGVPAGEGGWYAHAQYRGARIIAENHRGPVEAMEALTRRLMSGGKCTHCGRTITLSSISVGRRCKWSRHGRAWRRGCEKNRAAV
jgi:hypothetical protein